MNMNIPHKIYTYSKTILQSITFTISSFKININVHILPSMVYKFKNYNTRLSIVTYICICSGSVFKKSFAQ